MGQGNTVCGTDETACGNEDSQERIEERRKYALRVANTKNAAGEIARIASDYRLNMEDFERAIRWAQAQLVLTLPPIN